MDFRLSSEQTMIQESLRKMVDRDIDPILKSADRNLPLPKDKVRQIVKICAQQGLTSARLPESAGGMGVSALTFGIMREQLPPTVSFFCGGQEGTALRIYMGGDEEQAERYVPALVAGDMLSCSGTTEPDAGSDPRAMRTRAVEDGDQMVVNGHKMWVTGAGVCDMMLVLATVGKNASGHNRNIWLAVNQEESPFVQRKIQTLGLKQGHLGEAIFDNCRVPKRNVIGDEGTGGRVLKQTWMVQRPMLGLLAVRMAERALEAATKYAGEREMFGRKIGGFQLVQQLLADIATAVTTSRLLCYYALNCIDNGAPSGHASSMAKRYSIDACTRAISLAMEVHGAMGISTELGLEELYRDARMLPIPDGTNQILTLIEGRELTGISAIRG